MSLVSCFFETQCTQGEVTSQNLWSRYDRHFAGITWHHVWSLGGEALSYCLNYIKPVGL